MRAAVRKNELEQVKPAAMVASLGGDVTGLVPPQVAAALAAVYAKK